ncbi:prokaryotic E2 ligase family D protein [bacterium]|nr:prokaryotic E2 ligase family D protein [bacterium]
MHITIKLDDQSSILPWVEVVDGDRRRAFFADPQKLMELIAKGLGEAIPKRTLVIPPGLFATDNHDFAVWIRPAGIAKLFVRFGESDKTPLKVPLPPLALKASRSGQQHVMALKTDHPTLNDRLYLAPFPNHSSGNVCMASGDRQETSKSWLQSMQANFDIYFSSIFSGHTVSGKSKKHPADVRELLADLDGQSSFPMEELIPAEMTLGEFMESRAR